MAGMLHSKYFHELPGKTLLGMVFFCGIAFSLFGQEKCLTDIIYQKKLLKSGGNENVSTFESWLSEQKKFNTKPITTRQSDEVLVIPVVIHIIHNGEALGVASNIPDEQVYDQLLTLNEDFRRLNTDAEETLESFKPVAADTRIEFHLAQTDPEGIPTNGIVRVQGYKNIYSDDDDATFKSLSYWPAEDYLNIWVIPMSNSYLGYAQFPVSDLAGLEDAVNNRLTDGVVVNYRYFGTGYNADDFSKGRTATHEIGHFLGLRHIWGDGGCSATDYCDDTPPASSSTIGCNLQRTSCNNLNMIQNYMDYSNDVCMNLFTADQAQRMNIVLNSSQRRKTLLSSDKENAPTLLSDDLGIRSIISPQLGVCEEWVWPSVEIRNYGQNNVNGASISLFADEQFIETVSENFVLTSLDTRIIQFSPIQLSGKGAYNFRFQILDLDERASNNERIAEIFLPDIFTLPVSENFDDSPSDWRIINPDGQTTWEKINIEGNNVLKINHFDYTDGFGEMDYFISPILDLTPMRSARLEFRMAHSRKPNGENESLILAVSKDCGASFDIFNPIYSKSGIDLATVTGSSTAFTPSNHLEWRKESINLNQFLGDSIQIAFISLGANGNNIFLDDIELKGKEQHLDDLAILSVNRYSPVVCDNESIPVLIKNLGTEPLISFSYVLTEDTETILENNEVPTEAIEPGGIYPFTIPYSFAAEKLYSFSLSIASPNTRSDQDLSDNHIEFQLVKKDAYDIVPNRQNFTKALESSGWVLMSPSGQGQFEILETSSNHFWANYHYQSNLPGNPIWLISPSLNLKGLTEASLGFDVATAYNFNYADTARVLVSTNCGPFSHSLLSASGKALSEQYSIDSWTPSSRNDWENLVVDLTDFVGNEDVRVALVVINGAGNNLFIDNVAFYPHSSPQLLDRIEYLTVYPNPSFDGEFGVVLNMPEREDIVLQVINPQGSIIYENKVPNALNQDFFFNLTSHTNGLYIIRAYGKNWHQSRKMIIMR